MIAKAGIENTHLVRATSRPGPQREDPPDVDSDKGFISLTEKQNLDLQALAAGLVADPAGAVAERFKGPVAAGDRAILVASARTVIHCEVPATK